MRESIIMTVYNRSTEVLLNTVRSLVSADLTDTEIIIVDDGSTIEYPWIKSYIDRGIDIKWIRAPEYEAVRVNGINNPAKAFNLALEAATGEAVCVLSSDVIVPPNALERARAAYAPDVVWCPTVINTGDAKEYCGSARIFPMPWMLYTSKAALTACGGWDENFLRGLCWEDNDMVARLALVTRGFIGDWRVLVWHQTHPLNNPAPGSDEGENAILTNKAYAREKWGGLPFGDNDPIEMTTMSKEWDRDYVWLSFRDGAGKRDAMIAATNSPFVRRA